MALRNGFNLAFMKMSPTRRDRMELSLGTMHAPEPKFETDAWMGRGFSPDQGVLTLNQGRLRFTASTRTVFDEPVSGLRLTWPWYGFGCQFWAHTAGEKYFVSALHPVNTLGTWWAGIKRGRGWHRNIKQALRG